MSDGTRAEQREILITKARAAFALGIVTVVFSVLAYLALAFFFNMKNAESAVNSTGGFNPNDLLDFTPHGAKPGMGSRALTMLFWGFLGSYSVGFLICRPETEREWSLARPPFHRVLGVLAASLAILLGLGLFGLRLSGQWWPNAGASGLSFAMGFVGGVFIYAFLSDKVPDLFPMAPPE